MIPNYHTKSHFKGETGNLMMQTESSLKTKDQDLRVNLKLNNRVEKGGQVR